MIFKLPKDDSKYQWTNHVKDKMIYYRISESLIKRIVRFPKRVEEGIAPGTTAAMQPRGSGKRQQEIWIMYQEIGRRPISNLKPKIYNLQPRLKIISAWRYPGQSPIGKPIPIPEDILSAFAGGELDIK